MTGSGDIIDRIAGIFERWGKEIYAGEAITVSEHMLQTAALAQASGAPDALVAAALLHDIGHLTGEFGSLATDESVDRHHADAGARMLAADFPPIVVDCVRLHVAAKRYLCAVEPHYYAGLSPASQHSLALQGGPMDADAVTAFCREPFHQAAVSVRRWDDGGKATEATAGTFDLFRPLLERVITR